MNIFRLFGDLSHLLAIIILLQKLWKSKSCAGISGKSQVLFAIVYTARYLDLVFYISAYNTFMKLFYIAATYSTVYLVYIKHKETNEHNPDTFRIEFLVLPAAVLALSINHAANVIEVFWAFSIYLESVAILPQLYLLRKTGEVESVMWRYLFALCSYWALYLLNWIYRYYTENHYDLIAIGGGIVQTALYCDFYINGNLVAADETEKHAPVVVHGLAAAEAGVQDKNLGLGVHGLPQVHSVHPRLSHTVDALEEEETQASED